MGGADTGVSQGSVTTTNPLNGTYSLEIASSSSDKGGLINRSASKLINHTISVWTNINKTGFSGVLELWADINKNGTYTVFALQQLSDCINGRICTYIAGWEESAHNYIANDWVKIIIHVNSSGLFFFFNNQSALIRSSASVTSIGTFTIQSTHGFYDDFAICEGQTFDCVETAITDTCSCPGAGNNWEIDMSDSCNITSACDLTTGTLSFIGSGFCNCNASVDTTNLGDPGANGILYIQDSCLIRID